MTHTSPKELGTNSKFQDGAGWDSEQSVRSICSSITAASF